jgi:hypothetical protein
MRPCFGGLEHRGLKLMEAQPLSPTGGVVERPSQTRFFVTRG